MKTQVPWAHGGHHTTWPSLPYAAKIHHELMKSKPTSGFPFMKTITGAAEIRDCNLKNKVNSSVTHAEYMHKARDGRAGLLD